MGWLRSNFIFSSIILYIYRERERERERERGTFLVIGLNIDLKKVGSTAQRIIASFRQ